MVKWNNDIELQELFPEKYAEIKYKLAALKAGLPYRIYDATGELKDMITDMGAKTRDAVKVFGDKTLGEVSPSKYEYKTDIPLFVDRIIEKKGMGVSKIKE